MKLEGEQVRVSLHVIRQGPNEVVTTRKVLPNTALKSWLVSKDKWFQVGLGREGQNLRVAVNGVAEVVENLGINAFPDQIVLENAVFHRHASDLTPVKLYPEDFTHEKE
jgi:hypothetical protein